MGEQEGEGRLIGLQGELREALEAGEREQEMCQYLNTKLAEISQVEVGVVKEAKVVWEQKLEKSLTAMQGFVTENSKMEGDLDSWSESDKAAFRARMGLREDCGVGSSSKHRTTAMEATELRRERGRVDRLRLEVKTEQEEGRCSRKRLEECLERCGVLEEQLGRDEVPA